MSPSRIQTAAVVLRQRRSPHLERTQKRACPRVNARTADAACQARRAPNPPLYSPTLVTAQALFNPVVMGCWGETPLVSLVTACIIRSRRG